jgi:hypothetical protein
MAKLVENTSINSAGSDGVMFVVGTSVVRWKEVLVIIFLLLLWLYSVNRFLSIWREINYSAEPIHRNYNAALGKILHSTAQAMLNNISKRHSHDSTYCLN